jgi:hypothetical protein
MGDHVVKLAGQLQAFVAVGGVDGQVAAGIVETQP